MRMKKYTAPSIAEAMKLVRQELGEDAVIITSKVVVKKKLFGLIRHKNFEVLAGVDRLERKQTSPSLPDLNVSPAVPETPVEQVKEYKDEQLASELKSELADLKFMMKQLQKQTTQSGLPEEFLPFMDFLKRQELSEELITAISDEFFMRYRQKVERLTYQEMKAIAKNVLREALSELPVGGLSFDKKYINVLGPTGVGKTTTIAKMAARAVLEKKKKIGFITTDTYRIAAIEQLKTYANLLQAPIEIVYNANDYKRAIERFADKDFVFIDTAGRNFKQAKYVEDLKKLIHFEKEVESYLVLALTVKEPDLEMVIEQFSDLPIDKYIFTKLDETKSIGTMYNLMIKYNKGIAYYTNGQEVPEDIEEANMDAVLEMLFQGEFK